MRLRFLLSIMLSTLLFACAGNVNHESTGEYLDNTAITTKIKAVLIKDMGLATVTNISIASQKGLVTLSGTVDSVAQKYQAEHLAKTVGGVNAVENRLRIAIH